MTYSLSSIMNTTVNIDGSSIKPLKNYQSLNNLDLMTLEQFLFKYNRDLDKFTLKQLVAKLENNIPFLAQKVFKRRSSSL